MLRVQLSHTTRGSVVSDITDPGQLDKFATTLERSRQNAGVFYDFTVSLDFNKRQRRLIKEVYEDEDIAGVISVNIYEYDPNSYRWTLEYVGEIKLDEYDIDETTVNVNIENASFERKFINLTDLDVDLGAFYSRNGESIPLTPTIDLEYHAKTILKEFDGSPFDENEFSQPGLVLFDAPACATPGGCDRNRDATIYGQIDTSDAEKNEIDNTFTSSWGWTELEPFETYRAFEKATTDIDISLNLQHRVVANRVGGDYDIEGCGNNDLGHLEIRAFFEHRDLNDNVKTLTQIGTDWTIPGCPGFDEYISDFETKTYQAAGVNVDVGDKLFVYYTIRISGNYRQNLGAAPFTVDHEIGVTAVKEDTFIRFSSQTIFDPTTSTSILMYEVFDKICQVITDQPVAFRSSLLGRTDTVEPYAEDGKMSLIALTNGRNLRHHENTQMFASFDEALQSLNAKIPIAWGFETLDDGTKVVRLEEYSYFFDKDTLVLRLGQPLEKPKMKARKDMFYSKIETGFPKMENINQINGIDEFNTSRSLNSPKDRATGTLDLKSVYRSSGYEIESQRRLIGSTKESRLDDENFLTAVLRGGPGFVTEQATNYDILTNVFEPSTAYNLSLSPMRTLQNWDYFLASNVVRGNNKVFSFSKGTGNYLMTSRRIGEALILENGALNLTGVVPLWVPDEYQLKVKMRPNEFRLLKNNPYGYCTFIDTDGQELEGYLLKCKFTHLSQSADVDLLRLYRE